MRTNYDEPFDAQEISTLECCRRQFENILYCCNQEPPILVDSIRTYAEIALQRIYHEEPWNNGWETP